ncbi:MAG TPA: FAD-dependent oxidoreductase [Chthonomonadales bacterium]|nr:FAD-dependent oxidoreductase [Chthonomonadales bacterium]
MREIVVDVAVIGAGTGGCAAAWAAARAGARVLLTEETAWIGGQLTAQAVPPDEHPWIEQFGCTRSYRALRNEIRRIYREGYPLTTEARANPHLNPGDGWVSRLCCEPRVAHMALEGLLSYWVSSGVILVRRHTWPIAAEADGDRVRTVTLWDDHAGERTVVRADWFVDATELGDLLPMCGAEYVTGAESASDTDEPHAASEPAPGNEQAITWVMAVAHDPGSHRVIDRPASYERWRDEIPPLSPAWPGPLLAWQHTNPITLEPRERVLFEDEASPGRDAMWPYRRIVSKRHYPEGAMPHEVTIVNWPQNDYFARRIIDVSPNDRARALEESRQLSLSLHYWLQTEAPRADGGVGYPGLYLRPDMTGTGDGLAMYPYIRESRRIRAAFTVCEQHVGVEARRAEGQDAAVGFADSVGIGCYRIDLHPSTGGDNYIDVGAHPFQIPLGALVPVRLRNLLAGCKNLGTTHITNGCYRLHPVEWNVGEAAGALAAFCRARHTEPHAVRERPDMLRDYQAHLEAAGVELRWPRMRPV